jgi:large subunit ribosomal protein L24
MKKIRKGDKVIILTGKDKGREGSVLTVFDNDKVLVENLNLVKKHQKPNPQKNIAGGIVEKEMPMHVSNVALLNPATGKADKIGIKVLEDGEKVRIFRSNNEVVDV